MDLDTALLRSFLACTRLGSIGRAAAALGRTQPALSQQLRRLEDLVGEPLLDRTQTGIKLTQAGAAFLPYAERILALSTEALRPAREKLSGRCAVGVVEDFTGTALPSVFSDFARLHPETTLQLVSLFSAQTQAALDSGQIQLGLCDASFLRRPLRWSLPMPLLWAAAENFDAAQDPLPLIVFSEPSAWPALMQSALSSAGRASRIAFETNSLTAALAATRAGLGLTALFPTSLAPGIITLPPSPRLPALPDIEIGLYRRPESANDKLVDAVEAMLKQLVQPIT